MSEWQECKLGEICSDISYGYTESASLDPIGPKFLRITDIVPGRVNWETVPYCKITSENRLKYKLHEGDIVIARTGATTGYNYTIKPADIKHDSVFASYLIRYRINPTKAEPFFIGDLLSSTMWQGFVEGILGGSAQPGANAKQFADFEILLPTLPEQRAIAGVLSSLDDKNDLLHRQNKTLEGMGETLFRKWFVEEADPKWRTGKLRDYIQFEKGKKPNETFEEYSIGLVPQILIETFDSGKTLFSEPQNMVTADEKDILMVMDGASSGRAEIGFTGIVGSTIGLFKPISSFDYPFFIYYLLKSTESYIQEQTTGSAIPHADKALILDLDIQYPNIERVIGFEKMAESLFEKKKANRRQIRTLSRLRDTLLPKLMSGEVRVKV